MKITFLGTCAGTEPMPTRNHTSFCIEENGRVYWFDAGEGCSRTAHLMGIDLLAIKKIIISHAHMDHIGGLANLLWSIKKLCIMNELAKPKYGDIGLYSPNMNAVDAALKIAEETLNGYNTSFDVKAHSVQDGILFDEDGFKVTAFHNFHLGEKGEPWRSFTYRIETDNKTVVYSGDVKNYSELDEAIGNSCDALIIETGHHKIDSAYEFCKDKKIGKIFFNHCGREILNNYEASAKKIAEKFGDKAVICEDKMVAEI